MRERPQPTRNGGHQGERLSESSASRLAAHAELGGLRADLLLAWAHGGRRLAQASCVRLCVACLSAPRVVGGRPRVEQGLQGILSSLLSSWAGADAASCLEGKGRQCPAYDVA